MQDLLDFQKGLLLSIVSLAAACLELLLDMGRVMFCYVVLFTIVFGAREHFTQ